MKYDDFSWDDIVLEAPGDDADMGDDLAATDYADAEGMDIEEEDPMAEEGDPADEDPLSEEGEEEDEESCRQPEKREP